MPSVGGVPGGHGIGTGAGANGLGTDGEGGFMLPETVVYGDWGQYTGPGYDSDADNPNAHSLANKQLIFHSKVTSDLFRGWKGLKLVLGGGSLGLGNFFNMFMASNSIEAFKADMRAEYGDEMADKVDAIVEAEFAKGDQGLSPDGRFKAMKEDLVSLPDNKKDMDKLMESMHQPRPAGMNDADWDQALQNRVDLIQGDKFRYDRSQEMGLKPWYKDYLRNGTIPKSLGGGTFETSDDGKRIGGDMTTQEESTTATDGSTTITNKNGTTTTINPDGSTMVTSTNGATTTTNLDGSTTVVETDGVSTDYNKDGSVRPKKYTFNAEDRQLFTDYVDQHWKTANAALEKQADQVNAGAGTANKNIDSVLAGLRNDRNVYARTLGAGAKNYGSVLDGLAAELKDSPTTQNFKFQVGDQKFNMPTGAKQKERQIIQELGREGYNVNSLTAGNIYNAGRDVYNAGYSGGQQKLGNEMYAAERGNAELNKLNAAQSLSALENAVINAEKGYANDAAQTSAIAHANDPSAVDYLNLAGGLNDTLTKATGTNVLGEVLDWGTGIVKGWGAKL